jgi:tRNA A-37 threonylcarbamoyl transferase component Bud32
VNRKKHVIRYHILPVWLFSIFLTFTLLGVAAFANTVSFEIARRTIDVIKFGPEKGMSAVHFKEHKDAMTCASCHCGAVCACCNTYHLVKEPYSAQEKLLAGAYVIALLTAFLRIIAGPHTRIILTESKLSFPLLMSPSLLLNRSRAWSDLGSVSLSKKMQRTNCDPYDFESMAALTLRLYFRSGGSIALKLKRLSQKDLEALCQALHDWRREAVISNEAETLIKKILRKNDLTPTASAPESFTAMWDEEMTSHLGATTFVPLDKGAVLQNGRLKVINMIASGGLSAVYLVEIEKGGFAILKESVIPNSVDDKTRQKAKELFSREASLLMKLDHPAIARVLDHLVENGRDYMLLEYVPGISLRQHVRQNGPASEKQVLAWAKELASTLTYLHELSPPVVHRDLTPDNVVLRKDGALVLIDFGAANEYVGQATGTLIGKQSYISPEQFRGKAEPSSDIYALGGTLNFLLTGEDPEPLSASHPRNLRSELSPDIDRLVADCTALSTDERVRDARALVIAVDRLSDSAVSASLS